MLKTGSKVEVLYHGEWISADVLSVKRPWPEKNPELQHATVMTAQGVVQGVAVEYGTLRIPKETSK